MRNGGSENQLSLFPQDKNLKLEVCPSSLPEQERPSPVESEAVIAGLNEHIEAVGKMYQACVDCLEHSYGLDGIDARIRLHFVRLDGNGEPRFRELAECLVRHVINYSLDARRRGTPHEPGDYIALFTQARDLFRHSRESGESGELLLYFLLESVLGAPQVVCKMGLKTHRQDEIKGADALHMKWNTQARQLEVYFGEAKLHQSFSGALSDALAGIEKFERERKKGLEFGLITSNFKLLDSEIQRAVLEFVTDLSPKANYRVTHACLIGYDWAQYKHLDTDRRKRFISEFKAKYRREGELIQGKLAKKLAEAKHRKLSYEFFFIPFKSVQEFRDAFYDVLFGVNRDHGPTSAS